MEGKIIERIGEMLIERIDSYGIYEIIKTGGK